MLDPLGYQLLPRYKEFVAEEEDEISKNTLVKKKFSGDGNLVLNVNHSSDRLH
jgi:hypothetical protein